MKCQLKFSNAEIAMLFIRGQVGAKKGDCGENAIATENHNKTALHGIEYNFHAANLLRLGSGGITSQKLFVVENLLHHASCIRVNNRILLLK